ncbi:MAG TPA: TMEM165/GDT1 family protein [Thermoanaerobaculia bacterium]|jgi:putative Ca2+/H+ antiporter (TMEM165/GDT1 family)
MLAVLLTVYATVLAAEVVGDKSLYTIGSLTTRFRFAPVAAGVIAAHAVKIGAAVLAGHALASLSRGITAAISSATFLMMAVVLWRKPPERERTAANDTRWPHATAVSFAAIVCSEWLDVGQLAVAALAARFAAPLVVWSAAMLAMLTKASVAMLCGVTLRHRLPPTHLRYIASGICVVMAIVSAAGAA